MAKILLVPDIHGREFWKKVKTFKGEIVFLGDYLDPYNFEFDLNGEYEAWYRHVKARYNEVPDRKESCIENFKEIIEFAKSRDNVTLLLGNHDLHYIYPKLDASRKDIWRFPKIKELFDENSDLFSEYYAKDALLCTHAGVTKEWIANNFDETISYKEAFSEGGIDIKFQVSSYRGGWDRYSGPFWLDVGELTDPNRKKPHLYIDDTIKYQVFGHTMQVLEGDIVPVINGACIDSREVFEIDTENPEETLKIWEEEN